MFGVWFWIDATNIAKRVSYRPTTKSESGADKQESLFRHFSNVLSRLQSWLWNADIKVKNSFDGANREIRTKKKFAMPLDRNFDCYFQFQLNCSQTAAKSPKWKEFREFLIWLQNEAVCRFTVGTNKNTAEPRVQCARRGINS